MLAFFPIKNVQSDGCFIDLRVCVCVCVCVCVLAFDVNTQDDACLISHFMSDKCLYSFPSVMCTATDFC